MSLKSMCPVLPAGWILLVMPGAGATTVLHENVKDLSVKRWKGPTSPLAMEDKFQSGSA